MKALLSVILSILFAMPAGYMPKDAEPAVNHVITHVKMTQSPDAYAEVREEIINDYYFEYDKLGRLVKADSAGYQWMSLFSPSILYTNITEGTDFYEYEGDGSQPVKITRTDNNGKERFTVTYDYDSDGRVLKETFINKNGHKIISDYRYENEDGYDYIYVDRDDDGDEENFRFRYYEDNGWLKAWKYTEHVGVLSVRRDAEIVRDAHGRVSSVIRNTPNLTLESSWTFKFQYDAESGDLSDITYTHPFEGTGYILEFTWEDK